MSYTLPAFTAAALTLVFDMLVFKTKIVRTRHYLRFTGFMTIGFLLCNGILTAVPVVTYNPSEMLNIRFFTIPVEDFVYGFALVTSTISIYEFINRKEAK